MSSKNEIDTKQIIHIASEVVVLIGLVWYFNSKNKNLLGHIEELSQRIEDQEEHIQKLETTLQQMSQKFEMLSQQVNNGFMQVGQTLKNYSSSQNTGVETEVKKPKIEQKKHVKIEQKTQPSKSAQQNKPSKPVDVPKQTKIQFNDPPRTNNLSTVYEDDEDDLSDDLYEFQDDDLDEEIRQELEELESGENVLKKQ
jgi:hypothetical protein